MHRYKQAVMRAGLSAINHGCGDFNVSRWVCMVILAPRMNGGGMLERLSATCILWAGERVRRSKPYSA